MAFEGMVRSMSASFISNNLAPVCLHKQMMPP